MQEDDSGETSAWEDLVAAHTTADRHRILEDTDRMLAILIGLFQEVDVEMREDAMGIFAGRVADVYAQHGVAEPAWLKRLRFRLEEDE
jgi:hypothetical protein